MDTLDAHAFLEGVAERLLPPARPSAVRIELVRLISTSRKLALAVNGDFERVLQRYQKLLSTEQPADSGRFIRGASRKLIRSTNILRSETGTDWPVSLEEHITLLTREYPERGDDMRYFLEQALKPDEEPKRFATRLGMFSDWMADAVRQNSQ